VQEWQGLLQDRTRQQERLLDLPKVSWFPVSKGVPDFQKWAWDQKNFEIKSALTGVQKRDTEIIAKELAEQGWLG